MVVVPEQMYCWRLVTVEPMDVSHVDVLSDQHRELGRKSLEASVLSFTPADDIEDPQSTDFFGKPRYIA